jgi:hypothetical protein
MSVTQRRHRNSWALQRWSATTAAQVKMARLICPTRGLPSRLDRVPGSSRAKTYGSELWVRFQTLAGMLSTTFPKTMRGLQGAMQ